MSASSGGLAPLGMRRRLEALQAMRGSEDFAGLSVLFKRVKNIAREVSESPQARYEHAVDRSVLTEAAEQALLEQFDRRAPVIRDALRGERYRQAMSEAAALRPAVDRFFTEVFVMADDPALRASRLMLMVDLRDLIMQIADISQLGG